MPLQVNQNSSAPSSLDLPDGTKAFPLISNAATSYPAGATPARNSSGNVANAIATCSLASATGKTVHITGFSVTGAGATAALPVVVTVTGIGGTLSYVYCFAAGALVANTPLIVDFRSPIVAGGTNVNIVVTCPASGAGGTHNAIVAHGYLI